ncbi:hypothetical protein PCLA_14r0196 [Pseudomonas citronellolis]|nr:hypothetical protein PCLA_14r0196 [Pseudomonas citronellolis]
MGVTGTARVWRGPLPRKTDHARGPGWIKRPREYNGSHRGPSDARDPGLPLPLLRGTGRGRARPLRRRPELL